MIFSSEKKKKRKSLFICKCVLHSDTDNICDYILHTQHSLVSKGRQGPVISLQEPVHLTVQPLLGLRVKLRLLVEMDVFHVTVPLTLTSQSDCLPATAHCPPCSPSSPPPCFSLVPASAPSSRPQL